jgi:dolichol-phosphate mannosyltransferase
LPPLVDPEVSRDFVHVRDAVRAFVRAAMYLRPKHYGESYNVGTGTRTTIRQLAELAVRQFGLDQAPEFGTMPGRSWDRTDWVADPRRFESAFGWKAELSLADGLGETVAWWREFLKDHDLAGLTKKQQHPAKSSVSAVIACYKDGQAIPIMYDRLRKTFEQEGVDYEIIFVNDCSPDDSTEAIRKLTEADANVIGIVHSRNFGSQAAFRSGMEVASKEACVLLDGDLQDPPELISEFIAKWRDGADVVYGRRVHREMPFWREWCYKGFYRLFAWLGEIPIPRDAGDFSLLDWRVVQHLLSCQERDYFLRGLRAYVGFRQEGVDYVRPERAFGVSTNNWAKNIGWAKKGILAFSRTPLQSITVIGSLAILAIVLFSLYLIVGKLLFPQIAPKGVTMGYLLTMALGAANLFALGVLGEYIGKIIEESKGRPPFIRAARIQHGDVIEWS